MIKLMGFSFMIAAIYYFVKSMKRSKAVNDKSSIKLTGAVVDNKVVVTGSGMATYYPVYEYELDGEVKQHASEFGQLKPTLFGTKIFLYYNKSENKIIELTAPATQMALSVVFALAAMVILFVFE